MKTWFCNDDGDGCDDVEGFVGCMTTGICADVSEFTDLGQILLLLIYTADPTDVVSLSSQQLVFTWAVLMRLQAT